MDKLPESISPCPLQEAVVEVRFSSILPAEAVFGVMYTRIGGDFGPVSKLPILQIPEAIRSQDPNLMYQAHYLLPRDNLSLKIGPRVLTFSNATPYIGWKAFFPFVTSILEKIKDTGVIQLPERIGIRYINFFETPIMDKLNLEIRYESEPLLSGPIHLRTERREGNFLKTINVANSVLITLPNGIRTGSLVDIDCGYTYPAGVSNFYASYQAIIEEGHMAEKSTFFGLLRDEFLKTLNPNY